MRMELVVKTSRGKRAFAVGDEVRAELGGHAAWGRVLDLEPKAVRFLTTFGVDRWVPLKQITDVRRETNANILAFYRKRRVE